MSVRPSQSVLRITPDIRQAMVDHAWDSHPIEACGIVTDAGRVVRITNAAQSRTSYRFDDAEYLDAWCDMAKTDERLLIVYHSHTTRDATPSSTDERYAVWPEAFYVIVSTFGDEDDVQAYQLFHVREGLSVALKPVPIEIVPSISQG